MSNELNIYEEIDLYLKGKLNGEQKDLFERRISSDPAFAQKVKAQKIANQVIITNSLSKLQEKIKQDLSNRPQENSFIKKLFLSTLVLLSSASIIYFMNHSSKTETKDSKDTSFTGMEKSLNDTTIEEPKNIQTYKQEKKESNHIIYNQSEVKEEQQTILPIISEPSSITSTKTVTPPLDTIETKNTDLQTKEQTVDCNSIYIQAYADVNPTCIGKEEGSILIDVKKIKGGDAPYLFSLDEEKNYSSSTIYSNLKGGSHTIHIIDKNQCKGKHTIKIEEKKCETVSQHVLNPYHSNWEIPVENNKEGELKIVNKAGVLVYSQNLGSGYPEEWNGKDINGQLLEKGLYVFQIEYQDGTNQKGYITIMY